MSNTRLFVIPVDHHMIRSDSDKCINNRLLYSLSNVILMSNLDELKVTHMDKGNKAGFTFYVKNTKVNSENLNSAVKELDGISLTSGDSDTYAYITSLWHVVLDYITTTCMLEIPDKDKDVHVDYIFTKDLIIATVEID